MGEICLKVSRAATDIFSSESAQMKAYLQIGSRTKGSVPFFLNFLFLPWISGAVTAVDDFGQGRASDMKEECKKSDQDGPRELPDRSWARGRRIGDRDSNSPILLLHLPSSSWRS